jgi:hypothetical protein
MQNSAILDAGEWSSVVHVENETGTALNQLTIMGGVSDGGGGIVANNSFLSLQRCIITANAGYISGAIKAEKHSYLYILNSTIVGNDIFGATETGGIYISDSHLELANSILWDNSGLEISVNNPHDTSKAALAYNCIEGDTTQIESDAQSLVFLIEGNIAENPLFLDIVNMDFRLHGNSPCVDSGIENASLVYNSNRDTLFIPALEFIGSAPDMGAFEYLDPSGIYSTNLIPDKFNLFQNYPNPFNPVTTIRWQLASDSRVELTIYNLIGQKVAMLFSGEQEAGTHQVRWDASDFASGVYIYRLTTDAGYSQTRKLVLLR